MAMKRIKQVSQWLKREAWRDFWCVRQGDGRVQNEAMVSGIACLEMTAYDYKDKKE